MGRLHSQLSATCFDSLVPVHAAFPTFIMVTARYQLGELIQRHVPMQLSVSGSRTFSG